METELKEQISILDSMFKLGDDDSGDIMQQLLSLPDEEFALVAPTVQGELELALNDPNNRMELVQSLNNEGYKVEDILKAFSEFADIITTRKDELKTSPLKVNFILNLLTACTNSLANIEGIARRFITVPITFTDERAKCPAYANVTDAGLDVYALEDITINPGETKLIPLGIKIAVPVGYEMQVRAKSGRCLKTKLRVANAPGTIDSGYRGEVGVIIDNIDAPIKNVEFDKLGNLVCTYGSSYTIGAGEKFAQFVLKEQPKVIWQKIENIDEVQSDGRGEGGFGSTGLN